MTIKKLIEPWSFEDLEIQKKVCANVRKSDGDWSTQEEDAYTMGYETGALKASQWWAERWKRATEPLTGTPTMAEGVAVIKNRPVYDELDAAAKEILHDK